MGVRVRDKPNQEPTWWAAGAQKKGTRKTGCPSQSVRAVRVVIYDSPRQVAQLRAGSLWSTSVFRENCDCEARFVVVVPSTATLEEQKKSWDCRRPLRRGRRANAQLIGCDRSVVSWTRSVETIDGQISFNSPC